MSALTFAEDSLAASIRLGTPLLFAALGEMFVQRSGVLNIGIEGLMLTSAFSGVVATDQFIAAGWPAEAALAAGVLLAIVSGLFFSSAFAAMTVVGRRDQIVAGMALNLAALGLTGTLHRALFLDTGRLLSVPTFPPLAIPGLVDLPLIGRAFDQSLLVYLAALTVPIAVIVLFRSRLGLWIRAAGENPLALDAAGISVSRVRFGAVLIGGALAGLAGATLTLGDASSFAENMTAGRGFIALAVVIFGRWHPGWIAAVALFFGAANAAQFRLQALGLEGLPHQALLALPYLASLVALAWSGGRPGAAPSMLGRPYRRGERERET
ncbi:MAG: ABC transporter permease [Planctomycetota bacterium]